MARAVFLEGRKINAVIRLICWREGGEVESIIWLAAGVCQCNSISGCERRQGWTRAYVHMGLVAVLRIQPSIERLGGSWAEIDVQETSMLSVGCKDGLFGRVDRVGKAVFRL